jgi:cobalt-zinc-cadmium efflux system protein
MEATPDRIDAADVRVAMTAVPGVEGVHDLHVWTVTSGLIALSSHVEVTKGRDWHETLVELTTLLRERFGIVHTTLQPEEPHAHAELFRGCSLDSPAGRVACRVPAVRPAGSGSHALHGHRH